MPETDTQSLDAQLAEALGWRFIEESRLPWRPPNSSLACAIPPKFSTDGNAMLDLVAAMRERGYQLTITTVFGIRAGFWKEIKDPGFNRETARGADTFPEAVAWAATAALAALTGETK